MKGNIFRAVILGAPGSGKGTISSRILKTFDMKHLSSGDILRGHILNKTDLGEKAKDFIDKGQLVPDSVMVDLIMHEIKQLSEVNWLLDGFPRTKVQAEELHKKTVINAALNLAVPFDVIIKRIQERWIHPASGRVYNISFAPPKISGKDDVTGEDLVRRSDDEPEAVAKRLQVYASTINPVLDFYRERGVLKDFHGKTSDDIWPQVLVYMSQYLKPKEHFTEVV
ncbi:GTP:AMP phosphotransferase AK3, mitochondrial [Anabrus simplex]|uniref:GTP:AMP phosphotransferase AK3, mitochondrial n=1 Tax=Anabrus simplex TaxID=316456 RepID=UPI0034DDA184